MSLEERGRRPEPMSRGATARYINGELDREMRRRMAAEMACVMHEMMWGVPCGPTLSMVQPTVVRGILVPPHVEGEVVERRRAERVSLVAPPKETV